MEWVSFLQRVDRLRWRLRRPVADLLAGPYRSVFRGEGIEFADARPYEAGDDLRRIHWSLSARKNSPYVRLGQEERELLCVLAIDRSASMRIAPEKEQLTLEAVVALALSAQLNGDRVRWVTFTSQVERFSAARRGEMHIWGSLAQLWQAPPTQQTSRLGPLLHWFAHTHRRRCFLGIVSDLFFQDSAWPLLRALAQRHFVLLVSPYAAQEWLSLPWGFLPVTEVETGQKQVVRGRLQPTTSVGSLRWAQLLPNLSPIDALRAALLPPLH